MKDENINNSNLSDLTVSKKYQILELIELNSVSEAMGGNFSCGAETRVMGCSVGDLGP